VFSSVTASGALDGVRAAQVVVQFGLELRSESGGVQGQVAATVRAVFVVRYSLNDGPTPTESEVEAFAKLNGAFNAYTYWRHFLQESLFRAGLPRVALSPFVPGRHAAHSPPTTAPLFEGEVTEAN